MNKYIKEFSQYPDFEHNNFFKGLNPPFNPNTHIDTRKNDL